MEIPLKFQNNSKWNLNRIPTTSYRITLNLKGGLFKKLGKSMCINQGGGGGSNEKGGEGSDEGGRECRQREW